MLVYCNLRRLMDDRKRGVVELAHKARVDRGALSKLLNDKWQRVDRTTIGGLCGELACTPNDLFTVIPDDIWGPIKTGREVTVHYGSRSLEEAPRDTDVGSDTTLTVQYISAWDMRAYKWITEYLQRTGWDVNVKLKEQVMGREPGYDPSVRDAVEDIFAQGNHVLLGSPVANQFTEEVVCHAYGVPPYTPERHEAFPYGFVWRSRQAIPSSFGWQGVNTDFGIWSARARKLVARRIMVESGEGKDCALILVYRPFVPSALRRPGQEDTDRVVICILGHSGAGTLAGARVATDPRYAPHLFPTGRNEPRMRVVSATYTRTQISTSHDNRDVTAQVLVEDEAPPDGPPDGPSGRGKRHRRKRPATAAPLRPKRKGGPR